MTVVSSQTAWFGANPFTADVATASTGTAGAGIVIPQFKVGSVTWGDAESEYVYVKYVSASNLVLQPGLAFTIDDTFTATLLTTANSPRGSKVMYSCVGLGGAPSITTVTGTTYYLVDASRRSGAHRLYDHRHRGQPCRDDFHRRRSQYAELGNCVEQVDCRSVCDERHCSRHVFGNDG